MSWRAVQLFLKEHMTFLAFQFGLLLFILVLFWLEGFRNIYTAGYVLLLGFVFTSGYLLLKYLARRHFYQTIVSRPKTMEALLLKFSSTPEHMETTRYMRESYKLYQGEVQKLYDAQHRQLHFINQWVHQMKTPLSVISLLLQEEEVNKKSMAEELDKMQRGLEAVLVNARLETFEEDMRIERVALRPFVQSVVNEHKRLFITNRVFPTIDIDEDIVVATDQKWLKIVLTQFITNAVKYTFEEGKKVYIEARIEEENIALSVRDEGIGIPASDLKRIRRPFFTGENGRLTGESTGMGLYIAQEVCTRLGHDFTVDSVRGEGTTMTVHFRIDEGGTIDERRPTDHSAQTIDEDL